MRTDDNAIIVSDEEELLCIGNAIRRYEAVVGVKINKEKLVHLKLVTWRGESMPSNNIVVY